jgi:hypothetical protein
MDSMAQGKKDLSYVNALGELRELLRPGLGHCVLSIIRFKPMPISARA